MVVLPLITKLVLGEKKPSSQAFLLMAACALVIVTGAQRDRSPAGRVLAGVSASISTEETQLDTLHNYLQGVLRFDDKLCTFFSRNHI